MTLTKEQAGWDDQVAASYVGKYILVDVTRLDAFGTLNYRQQLHGVIEAASFERGITISLRGEYQGEAWNMPPLLSSIRPAQPGVYQLQMTGEEIEDPDLLASWTTQDGS